jgi:transposase
VLAEWAASPTYSLAAPATRPVVLRARIRLCRLSAGLPPPTREEATCALRAVDFLDGEVGLIERELARQALDSEETRRLITVPGVSLVSAASFLAAVGDVRRFSSPRELVSYLGLDPRVRQSGEAKARHGRISKQGSPEARQMLCEAAWVVVRTPGPLKAFYERLRARRGPRSRSLPPRASWACSSGSCSLARRTMPSSGPRSPGASCARSSRRWAPGWRRGRYSGPRVNESRKDRERETEFARQAEIAYRRLVADWQPQPSKSGAGATPGRASSSHLTGQAARQGKAPDPAL